MFDRDTQHGWTFYLGPIYAFRCGNVTVITLFSKEIFTWHHRRK